MQPWSFPYLLTLFLALLAAFYLLGYFRLRKNSPRSLGIRYLAAFLFGLTAVWIAAGSPLAVLDHQLLLAHMIQHILLMAVSVPLLYFGEPLQIFSNALPEILAPRKLGEFLHLDSLRLAGRVLSHPLFCWFVATTTVIAWHVPALFEFAMHSRGGHGIQFLSFFVAGLLFWWPVFHRRKTVAAGSEWSVPLYLFLATLPCDLLSAFLTFSGQVVYRSYLAPHRLHLSALQDQEWAGVIMWVAVTFLYLVPAAAITIRLLSPAKQRDFDPSSPLQPTQNLSS